MTQDTCGKLTWGRPVLELGQESPSSRHSGMQVACTSFAMAGAGAQGHRPLSRACTGNAGCGP